MVDNDPEAIAEILLNIYENPSVLNELKKGVDRLYKEFEADKTLNEIFSDMLDKRTSRF